MRVRQHCAACLVGQRAGTAAAGGSSQAPACAGHTAAQLPAVALTAFAKLSRPDMSSEDIRCHRPGGIQHHSARRRSLPAFGFELPDKIQSVEGGGIAVQHAMVRCAAGRALRTNSATRSAARESDAARDRSMAGIAIVPEGRGAATVPNIASRRSTITVLSTVPRRFHTSRRIALNERRALQHGSEQERPHRAEAAAPTSSPANARHAVPHHADSVDHSETQKLVAIQLSGDGS